MTVSEVLCSYCTYKKHNKVAPSLHISVNVEYVEVHPKRKYRVIHILPFSALHKCNREDVLNPSCVQCGKDYVQPKCVKLDHGRTSSHKWLNKIKFLQWCYRCSDTVIPKFSYLLKYAEYTSNTIIAEAVHVISHEEKSCTLSKSLNSEQLHKVNLGSLQYTNDEPEKTTNHIKYKLKGNEKCANVQKLSQEAVFSGSRRGTLSKRLNSLIFFIHGLGGSADVWHYQMMFFSSQGYEVVAFDLLGHGMSSTPNDQGMYAFSEMLIDLLLIFDHYAKQRNIIVGHSYGCAFASSIYEKRPLAIKQLILISGGGPKALEPRHGLSGLLPVYGLALLKFLTCYHSGVEQEKSSHLMELVRISALPRYVLKYVLQGQKWEQGDRMFYGKVYCPTLLVYGAKDFFISLNDEVEMEKTMPYARLEVIDNAGHTVMLGKPNELNELIFKFLLSWET